MKATITNFMGAENISIKAAPIALLTGQNHQGKSSALRPISATLSGLTMPLGLKKQDAGLLVKLGSIEANVILSGDEGAAEINYPKAELRTNGTNPPKASTVAAGLESIIDMDEKRRVEYLRKLLNCLPTKDDFKNELLKKGIKQELIDTLWKQIEINGWEAQLNTAKEKGKSFKSQWAYVTGEQYGSKKGEIWTPEFGWDASLQTSSQEALQGQITLLNSELEDMIGKQAVSDDVRAKLTEEANSITELQSALLKSKKLYQSAKQNVDSLEFKAKTLPPLPEKGVPCPYCGENVIIHGLYLKKTSSMSKDEVAALKQQIDKISDEMTKALQVLEFRQSALNKSEQKLKSAQEAVQQLKTISSATIGTHIINAKREALCMIELQLQAFKKYTESQRLHNNIITNQVIVDALDENGIRRQAMERGLDEFNLSLKEICQKANWATVSINRDLTIYFAGRPYPILSASEQFRVRVTLQIAAAILDNSDAVVIDGAELLDANGRKGLLSALSVMKFKSFVGMMVNLPVKAPKLEKMGLGNVYWIEKGVSKQIKEELV
ncbi:MAG: hypothetical protein LBE20_03560 [Deltaproteobacteria bacterium]|jgi:hypothetical protein|nr:hypothetical protein [Deltaproteobacteria bacterium]